MEEKKVQEQITEQEEKLPEAQSVKKVFMKDYILTFVGLVLVLLGNVVNGGYGDLADTLVIVGGVIVIVSLVRDIKNKKHLWTIKKK